MAAAARIGDSHYCPVVDSQAHVGGVLTGVGAPTVLIGGMPAARAGDTAACAGSKASIVAASTSVFIDGRPAARVGDATSHGGHITTGAGSVHIG